MLLHIKLRYAREPELVAIRFNPAYSFQGLVKQALRAFINNYHFEIVMPGKAIYEKKSLKCDLRLDEKNDADIIAFLSKLKAPKSTFVRNLMIRYITGDTSYAYQDEELKELAITDKCKKLCATMTQSGANTNETERHERTQENNSERSELEMMLESLKKHNM